MAERRRTQRRPFDHAASIARIEDGQRLAECAVRDLSARGARLELNEAGELPEEFALLISQSGNVLRRCRVVWRKENELGVSFVGGAGKAEN